MVEQNTVNIFIDVRFILRALRISSIKRFKYKRVNLIGEVLCYGHKYYRFESYTRLYSALCLITIFLI